MLDQCLNPRFVGRVFRLKQFAKSFAKVGLNPRFVGRVFRRFLEPYNYDKGRLNPRFVGRVFRLQPVKNFFCFQ